MDNHIQEVIAKVQSEGFQNLQHRLFANRKTCMDAMAELGAAAANGLDVNVPKLAYSLSLGIEAMDTLVGLIKHDLVVNVDNVERMKMGVVLQGVGIQAIIKKLSEKGLIDEAELMSAWESEYKVEVERLQRMKDE